MVGAAMSQGGGALLAYGLARVVPNQILVLDDWTTN